MLSRGAFRAAADAGRAETDIRSLTVMSYNILAHAFCDGSELYETVPPEFMDPAHRHVQLQRRIASAGADLVCLQEVDMADFDTVWCPFFKSLGFSGELQDDNGRAPTHTVANATFWRPTVLRKRRSESRTRSLLHVFAVVQSNGAPSAEMEGLSVDGLSVNGPSMGKAAAKASESSGAASSSVETSTNAGASGASATTDQALDPPASPGARLPTRRDAMSREQYVFVANCHLQGAPQLPHLRIQQLRSVIRRKVSLEAAARQDEVTQRNRALGKASKAARKAERKAAKDHGAGEVGTDTRALQRQRAEPPATPMIVVGDFNSTEDGAVYRFLVDGSLPAGFRECDVVATKTDLEHPFGLRSAYTEVAGGEPPLTFTRPPLRAAALDFIFFSAEHFDATAALDPMDGEIAATVRSVGLPTETNGSDHLPIAAVLRWKEGR